MEKQTAIKNTTFLEKCNGKRNLLKDITQSAILQLLQEGEIQQSFDKKKFIEAMIRELKACNVSFCKSNICWEIYRSVSYSCIHIISTYFIQKA